MIQDDEGRRIRSVGTSCALVRALSDREEAGVTDLAAEVGVSKTTAFHHLSTLCEEGFVVRTDDGYRLSLRFLEVGEGIKNRFAIYREGREEVDALAEETGEYVNIVVEESGVGYIIHKHRGSQSAMSSTRIGQSIPLHSTGAGKAILAALPDDDVDRFMATSDLGRKTDRTLTTEEELRAELEAVRSQGFAVLAGEYVEGAGAVAAPVSDHITGVQGAISVSGPLSWLFDAASGDRYDRVSPDLADRVVETANRIEMRLYMSRV